MYILKFVGNKEKGYKKISSFANTDKKISDIKTKNKTDSKDETREPNEKV